MFKEYFILLLLAHVIGDFYFQTGYMSKRKDSSMKWVLAHSLFYWLSTMLVLCLCFSLNIFVLGTAAAALHAIIDILKYQYVKKLRKGSRINAGIDRNIFFADQLLHIICLIFIAYIAVLQNIPFRFSSPVLGFFGIVKIDALAFVCWAAALLIIHKPANILISKILTIYKPENKDDENKKDNNAGRFIGTIERIIILIFLSIGQYAAIGLVLTAKSIARYDKISKEKDFAEYYLIGTLISTLAVIVVSFIL
ncbi:MAG: DUF3307 domain-containing protein [Eubacteriales bacterium]